MTAELPAPELVTPSKLTRTRRTHCQGLLEWWMDLRWHKTYQFAVWHFASWGAYFYFKQKNLEPSSCCPQLCIFLWAYTIHLKSTLRNVIQRWRGYSVSFSWITVPPQISCKGDWCSQGNEVWRFSKQVTILCSASETFFGGLWEPALPEKDLQS